MIRASSTTSLVATGLVAFTIGLGTAFLFGRPALADAEPIVRPAYAIEPSRPVESIPANYTTLPREPNCNPFDVSDIAMEEILDQMIRRGWRAPTQGEAVALTSYPFDQDIEAVDPTARVFNARISGTTPAEVAVAAEPDLSAGGVELTPAVEPQPATPAPDKMAETEPTVRTFN